MTWRVLKQSNSVRTHNRSIYDSTIKLNFALNESQFIYLHFSCNRDYPVDMFDDRVIASVKSIDKQLDSRNSTSARAKDLSGLVPGSATLIFPGTLIIEDTFLEANSNRIELSSRRIGLSEANLQVDKVDNKSFRSITMAHFNSVQSNSSIAFTSTFPSSMASPGASVSA